MNRLALIVVALALAVPAGAADVEIQARFQPEEHVVTGSQWVHWEDPPAEAWLALLANLGREENPYLSGRALDQTYVWGFDPAWTEIQGVFWERDGGEEEIPYQLQPAPPTLQIYSLEDVLLHVELPGGEGRLRVDFRTRFPHLWAGEPGRLGSIYTWRFGWHPLPFTPPADGRWPLVLPSHRFRVSLELPAGWAAALPGEVSQAAAGDGVRVHTSFPEPVRSVALFLGPAAELRRVVLPWEGLTVEAVALPGDEPAMRALATHAREIMAALEESYGPCPHRRLLLVEHPNRVGVAMAADGVVYLPRWLLERVDLTAHGILSRYGQLVLAHELAHQWWGVGVGVDLDAENWLSEGLAQYAAIRWYEQKFGAQGGNLFSLEREGLGQSLAESAIGFVNVREHLTELPYMQLAFLDFDEAVVKPQTDVRYGQASQVRLYDKGYLVLRALAHLVGEDKFQHVLRAAYQELRGGTLTVEAFRSLCAELTGLPLEGFFAEWVRGDAQADYAAEGLERHQEGQAHVTRVHLRREGRGFLPVAVELHGPEGQTASRTWAAGAAQTETLVFHTPFPPQEVVVDPGHYAPDVNRLNNAWPRRFELALDKNRLPLDAHLVQVNPETRAAMVSYLDRFGWAIYPEALAAAGWVRYGRAGELSGFAQLTHTLTGEIAWTHRLWDQPETGQAGGYWVPRGELTLSAARRPYLTLGLSLSWQGRVNRVFQGQGSLLAVPGAGGRLTFSHTQELNLAPHTYLQLTLGTGFSSPELPAELALGLPELNAFGGPNLPQVVRGQRKLLLSAAVVFPADRTPYHLAGAALLTHLTPRLYVSYGTIWTGSGGADRMHTYAEVGGELRVGLELLGGLLPVEGVAGVAWPLPGEDQAVFYLGLVGR
ncbi:MAG: M1 family aminopeptidase [Candidatus Bipolaricaulaceae bacterium]